MRERRQTAKEQAYIRGFSQTAKELKLDLGPPNCPFGIVDDPTLDSAGAYDLGRADARDAARGRGAA